MGVPSTVLEPHVGMTLKGGAKLDAYGNNLACCKMSGDGWRTQQDRVKYTIEECCHHYGVPCQSEVYGLFAGYVAQGAACEEWPKYKRQAIVPDFMMILKNRRQVLLELKTIHQSKSNYSARAIRSRGGALERRAAKIHPEYHRKARNADINFNGHDPQSNGLGPIQARLNEFGRIQGLVVGPRGSASNDLHKLINDIAEIGAECKWRVMGARSQAEARGVIKGVLRRRIGISATRAAAQL